jgi:hypothetical protein
MPPGREASQLDAACPCRLSFVLFLLLRHAPFHPRPARSSCAASPFLPLAGSGGIPLSLSFHVFSLPYSLHAPPIFQRILPDYRDTS